MKKLYFWLLFLAITALPVSTHAHAPNQSYIFLRIYGDGVGGRFEITTEDINRALDLDIKPGANMEDILPYLPRIKSYYLEHVSFSHQEKTYPIEFTEPNLLFIELGDFLQLNFTLADMGNVPEALTIKYEVLFEKDPTHLGLQVIEYNWKAGIHNNEANVSLIFGPRDTSKALDLTEASVTRGILTMIQSGMHHIFIGLDHILFLLALLLPAVVFRSKEPVAGLNQFDQLNSAVFPGFLRPYAVTWLPNESFKVSLIYVVKIITFFTIAHTITLSLAALEVIKLPSSLVESIIALSIALAALNNIYPLLPKGREWIIALVFGLFHGFGFASVLADVGLGGDYVTLSLLGFNVGVEIGQLIIVLIIFPLLFILRRTRIYRPILIYGSVFLILVALSWFLDRSFGIDLMLDKIVEKIYDKFLRLVM